MLFSVVILSFNSERTLSRCLTSLERTLSTFGEPSEVFVIENGSKDRSAEILKTHQDASPHLYKAIFLSKNSGTTHSRNLALKQSCGKYILVLDSDAYIEHTCLKQLLGYLESNHNVGLVCPKLRYRDGRFQLSTDKFPTLGRKFVRFFGLETIQKNTDESTLNTGSVDYAISACWLIRSSAAKQSGLFDENIFYAPEDVDYCLQMWKSGNEIHYLPDAEMIHDAQELSRGFKFNRFKWEHLKGLFYLFFKHRYFFSTRKLRARDV